MGESNEEMKGNETKQDEPKREKVRVVDISLIKDFPGHPFLVKDDESMAQLVKSIEMNGVLNPVIARKIGEDQYELISGHRRKHACILLGIKKGLYVHVELFVSLFIVAYGNRRTEYNTGFFLKHEVVMLFGCNVNADDDHR